MRRALRPWMPALAFFYGLHWEHIETMPPPELQSYVDEIPTFFKFHGVEAKE